MKWETKRNFLIGGAFLAGMIGLVAYQATQTKDCGDSHHAVLVLIDYTDPIGYDANSAIKDRIWTIIEAAPNFSTLILRPILGVDVTGAMLDKETLQLCRPERPDFTAPWKGAVAIRETWDKFKTEVCGTSSLNAAVDYPAEEGLNTVDIAASAGGLPCGDDSRKGSFFDMSRPQSQSSPILEQVVDNTRRFLTVPDIPRSWDLVIVSDWKQYTQQLDLHTKRCVGSAKDMIGRIPTFIGPSQEDKPFKALTSPEAPSGRSSTITSLFVLRDGMSDEEADCLEREFAQQFIVPNTTNVPAANIVFERLPRTVAGK